MSSRRSKAPEDLGGPDRRRRWSAATGPRARQAGVIGLGVLNSLIVVVAQAGPFRDESRSVWTRALDWQPPMAVVVVAAVVAPVALLWRRRAPVAVTAVTAVAYLLSSVLLPLGFALLTVAVQRRDRVLVACTIGVMVVLWLSFGTPDPWYLSVGLAVLLASFWAFWGAYVGARRALLQSLRDRARRAEDEQQARAEQARQTERARIAREMHDVVAHKVSLIALQAGGLEVNTQLSPERVAAAAGQIRVTAREALEDLRSVLGVLRSGSDTDGGELLPQPGLADVAALVDRSRSAGLLVALPPVDGSVVIGVPEATGRTAFRVVQEALTNVTKHARGAATTVQLSRTGPVAGVPGAGSPRSVLVVAVTNRRPVAAGSLLPGSGTGLIGLRERVDLVGGRFDSGPTAEGGWRVRAELPVDAPPAGPAGPEMATVHAPTAHPVLRPGATARTDHG